jgi:hypothetical protein
VICSVVSLCRIVYYFVCCADDGHVNNDRIGLCQMKRVLARQRLLVGEGEAVGDGSTNASVASVGRGKVVRRRHCTKPRTIGSGRKLHLFIDMHRRAISIGERCCDYTTITSLALFGKGELLNDK